MITEPNELHPELMGPVGMNSFVRNNDPSRTQMNGSHVTQMLAIDGAEPKRIQTGIERRYGEHTFSVIMPENGTIVAIIDRYQRKVGQDSIPVNPETIVIYQSEQTGAYGCVRLTGKPAPLHPYLGTHYIDGPGMNMLHTGANIPKGTVFKKCPSIDKDGNYCFGINANMAFMSVAGVSEDGFIISESMARRLGYWTFHTRTMSWGSNDIALNLYGSINRPKPFPEIGEKIRGDAILMATRSIEPIELASVRLTPEDCMHVDPDFDHHVYAAGAGGTVIDVKVYYDKKKTSREEGNWDDQPRKYDQAYREFCAKIMDFYHSAQKRHGQHLQLTDELDHLINVCNRTYQQTHGWAFFRQKGQESNRVSMVYRKNPLDVFHAEIEIAYHNTAARGNKITDMHGGKGVIVAVWPDAWMPVDQNGNRADVISDPNATINRANPGRLFEMYYCDVLRKIERIISRETGIEIKSDPKAIRSKLNLQAAIESYRVLLQAYEIMAPEMADWFKDKKLCQTDEEIFDYIADVLERGVGIFLPTNSRSIPVEVVNALEAHPLFKPEYSTVTYVGADGVTRKTVHRIRIAQLYMIELEKTGEDWGAVSSPRFQTQGIIAQLGPHDKNARPARLQAGRVLGESEMRIELAYAGEIAAAEQHDRNSSPKTHRMAVQTIHRSDKPSAIQNLVDRRGMPYGSDDRPVNMVHHYLNVAGAEFVHTPYDPLSKDEVEHAVLTHSVADEGEGDE